MLLEPLAAVLIPAQSLTMQKCWGSHQTLPSKAILFWGSLPGARQWETTTTTVARDGGGTACSIPREVTLNTSRGQLLPRLCLRQSGIIPWHPATGNTSPDSPASCPEAVADHTPSHAVLYSPSSKEVSIPLSKQKPSLVSPVLRSCWCASRAWLWAGDTAAFHDPLIAQLMLNLSAGPCDLGVSGLGQLKEDFGGGR